MDTSPQLRNRILLPAVIGWLLAVFVSDLFTPLGVSIWALCVPAILAIAPLGPPKAIGTLAATGTALIVAGFFLSPAGGEMRWGVAKRAIGLPALWSPVLAMSMQDESLYAARVLRAGGRGYVMKGEGSDQDLAAAIRTVCECHGIVHVPRTSRADVGVEARTHGVNSSPALDPACI